MFASEEDHKLVFLYSVFLPAFLVRQMSCLALPDVFWFSVTSWPVPVQLSFRNNILGHNSLRTSAFASTGAYFNSKFEKKSFRTSESSVRGEPGQPGGRRGWGRLAVPLWQAALHFHRLDSERLARADHVGEAGILSCSFWHSFFF